jgi:asparagine synthase (glutamine-hydrolysing)
VILGIWKKDRSRRRLREELLEAARRVAPEERMQTGSLWADDGLAVCWLPEGLKTFDRAPQPLESTDGRLALFFQGKIYNRSRLQRKTAASGGTPGSGQEETSGNVQQETSGGREDLLVTLYRREGDRFLDRVNGKFAFALWDRDRRTLLLGRDRLGIEPLFYGALDGGLFFGTSLPALLAAGWAQKRVNQQVVLEYLLFCYNPDRRTILSGVSKLPAGHLLQAGPPGLEQRRYWQLSFEVRRDRGRQETIDEVVELITDAVRLRTEPQEPPGIFLSGGTDSSTLVSLTSQLYDRPLRTFSFRCRGESFDESSWAEFVARRFGTEHSLVPFEAASALLIDEIVRGMDEPFCDIGIEIGSYLLARAAGEKVHYVFSGEGGDEAFGGHPVYQADKMAALIDWIPGIVLKPLRGVLQKLPDSDQKKNWQVKAKRFAYSLSFPRKLLSHRWRTYYTEGQLRRLCGTDFLKRCDLSERYDGMLAHNPNGDRSDGLARSLYSDYTTLVDFYLRRLQLLRIFSVESRLPLLDHRLVEYAAGIPSGWKVRPFGETKVLYRQALEGIVPREILYGRPKLGHSVPLKNWLRRDTAVRGLLKDRLRGGALESRGIIRREAVDAMIQEHDDRVDNHSHRLWALLVLELWIREHLEN